VPQEDKKIETMQIRTKANLGLLPIQSSRFFSKVSTTPISIEQCI
jgi:hypothetical protein